MADANRDIRSLARSYTEQAISTLGGIMIKGRTELARIRAAEALLDRGYGKAAQAIGGTDVLPAIAIEQIVRNIVDPLNGTIPTIDSDSASVQAVTSTSEI